MGKKISIANPRQRRSLSGYSNFATLARDPDGALITSLMIAANDISLANCEISRFQDEGKMDRMERHLRSGAIQYFVRLMCGHLKEAVSLIEEVNGRPHLVALLKRCTPECQGAFDNLLQCATGGRDSKVFTQIIARMRHTIAFHYATRQVQRALNDLAQQSSVPPARYTLGLDFFLTRYDLADRVMDGILVRQIVGVPPGEDVYTALKPFEDFVNEKCASFDRFVREFAVNDLRKFAPG